MICMFSWCPMGPHESPSNYQARGPPMLPHMRDVEVAPLVLPTHV